MPGRKPPRRGETGNGFMVPPCGAVERGRRTSPSSTAAASVLRSLAACARARASNPSQMSTVAFTSIIVPRIPAAAVPSPHQRGGFRSTMGSTARRPHSSTGSVRVPCYRPPPCRRPARVLGNRPEQPSRLQSPHESAPGRCVRGARAAAAVRRSPRRGAETARPRARAAPPGSTGGGRTHRRDDHPARHAVLASGPRGGRRADSGRDAARGRRDLPGAPRGRRRTVERLSGFPAPGRPAERTGRVVLRGARCEAGPPGEGRGAAAASSVLGPAGAGAGHRTRADASGARRRRRELGELPGRGVRSVLPRRPAAVRGARRLPAGHVSGAGRSLRRLRVEAGLRGAASRRRSPLAGRRHHPRPAGSAGRTGGDDDGGVGGAAPAGLFPARRDRRGGAGPHPRAGAGAGPGAAREQPRPRARHAGRARQGARGAA